MSDDAWAWLIGAVFLIWLFGGYVMDVQADKEAGVLVEYEGSEHIPMGQ